MCYKRKFISRRLIAVLFMATLIQMIWNVKQVSAATMDEVATVNLEVDASVALKKDNSHAHISWKKVNGAVSYRIYRKKKDGGKLKKIADIAGKKHKFTDKTVVRGKYYQYRVDAVMEDDVCFSSDILTFGYPLHRVSSVRLASQVSSVKVSWKGTKRARYYKVYYAKEKDGKYKCAGTTKKTKLTVKKLADNHRYYFYVKACTGKKDSPLDSEEPKIVHVKTKKKLPKRPRNCKTIFAGDSITTGLTAYQMLGQIGISGEKQVVAAIGLNTITFRTRRKFAGRTGVEQVVANKPYRVYIMLGINEIHYRNTNDVIAGYREIIRAIRAGTPKTDIVALAVSPVTSTAQRKQPGFAQIPDFNNKLQALAKELGVKYYDYTGFLKDSSGHLQSKYSAGDGYHWTISAYRLFAQKITKYDKSLDE